ncbi:hypothetical protein [Nocardia sp. NPDC057668]|uniref:hypothetical protein n=1 Tax=Nocardia sp. NPDC057668 TaxID=3346202 RepID=UPI0036731485
MRGVGDFFERIIDLDVTAAEAGSLADRTVDWMVSHGRLRRETSGEAMYSLHAETGYLPGPEWPGITREWGADWIPGPVAVIVGRHAHYGGQGEIEPAWAGCPRCGARTVIIDYPTAWEADPEVWRPFATAIESWERTGSGTAACPSCAAASPITEWTWADEFALGALALDFWGWPPLTDEFVAELTTFLAHRVEHHSGKF